MVSELARLKIDLLLVGGSVCLTAKEKLLQAGIALVVQARARRVASALALDKVAGAVLQYGDSESSANARPLKC